MTVVAALLTCFNRRETTLAALAALLGQDADVTLRVHLHDDASSDGTADAVRATFPDVNVITGSGSAYWNGGMRVAWTAARIDDPDHYLWLNDDTLLDRDALTRLLRTHHDLAPRGETGPIVVGVTRDPVTGRASYGGVRRRSGRRPLRFELVAVSDLPQPVDTMHGNCVLIPRAVVARIGILDPGFTHAMGDNDYGLRARAAGIGVWTAPGTVGTCPGNPRPEPGRGPLLAELLALTSVKQLPPGDWARFTRRWAGPLWPLYWASPYARRAGRTLAAHLTSSGR